MSQISKQSVLPPDKTPCPACRTESIVEIGRKNEYLIRRCSSCKTFFTKVEDEDKEIKDLYDHYYDNADFELRPAVKLSLEKVFHSFEEFRQTGRLLDIGFGEGALLRVAAEHDWRCYGTELSPQALKYGANQGWTVSSDALNDPAFQTEGFDVVTLIELIEHVPNPDYFLQTAFSMLRPGGLLYLTTPNIQSINRRWLGVEWSVVCPPEHLTLWSPVGIKTALKRNKFALKEIRTEGFNPVEILTKMRTKKGAQPVEVNRNEAAFALNETFSSSSWRRAAKNSINKGLTTLKLGDSLKIWATKKV